MNDHDFGKYRLRELLARGGMAEIHLAVERMAHGGERVVVLKRILPSHKDDPDFVEFFRHEARVALQLSHPNVVQAYEFGIEGDTLYLAMEYVRGHSVLDVIRRAASVGRPVALDAVVKIACDIAGALDYAHRACDTDGRPLEIVHRDVSPHNIVLSRDGMAKLADFGIAKAACQEFKTRTGVIKGKFAYLAPEMLRRGGHFNHRADLFALGTVTYELITRRPLFRGANEADTMKRILSGKIPPLRELRPDCPAALEAVIHRALAREPAERYPTGAALLADLDEAARVSGIFPTTTRLRGELESLFEEGAPTSIWSAQTGSPEVRVARGTRSPEDAAQEAPTPVSPPLPAPVRPPPPSTSRATVRPASRVVPTAVDRPGGRLPSAPPAVARSGHSSELSIELPAAPLMPIVTGAPVTATLAVEDVAPLPPKPRLASPQLEAFALEPPAEPGGPLPDRQLEYFLGLASARRARAETDSAASSPGARLAEEALSLLLDDNLDLPAELGEGVSQVDISVPDELGPSDTARQPALPTIDSSDTNSATAEVPAVRTPVSLKPGPTATPLPLPPPPHRTPPPERISDGRVAVTLPDVGGPGDDEVSLFGDMADAFEPPPTLPLQSAAIAPQSVAAPTAFTGVPDLRAPVPWIWWLAGALVVTTIVLAIGYWG